MKIIAYLLVMLSALLVGVEINKLQKERLVLISDLVKMLDYMHTELSARPCRMDQLCRKTAKMFDWKIKDFSNAVSVEMDMLGEKSFQEIWNGCCRDKFKLLDGDSLSIISGLGESLGNFELSSQLTAIGNCGDGLRKKMQEQKEIYSNNSKINIAVPCSVACMILMVV